jgi:tetratricopeptide (TPR) repeat protein
MKGTNQKSISRRGRILAFASLFVVCLTSALATTADADPLAKPTNAVAREHLATGNRYYRLREFEKAVEEYKAGAVREDGPVFYYNLGQCYRQLGRYEDAIWHYERFLERGKPTGEIEASVKKFIVQMKDQIGKAAMKQPPVEPAPTSTGDRATSAQPAPASVPAEGRRRGMPLQRKLAIAVGAAGAATIGAGIVLGLRAGGLERDADAICPMSVCDHADEATELIDRGKTNALYANVAFGLGGAVLIGAGVLWITGSSRETKSMVLAPQVSRSFKGVAASVRF